MGCKYGLDRKYIEHTLGINSYIVGCKCEPEALRVMALLRINSYIVGCKWILLCRKAGCISELIVT